MRHRHRTIVIFIAYAACSRTHAGDFRVTSPAPSEVKRLNLSPFYKKYISVNGFPVVSSAEVSDKAVIEAAYLIDKMLAKRPDILRALTKNKVRFAVMAPNEMTTDIPEHSDLKPKSYWDWRARGLGPTRARPAVSCGEENLLNLPGDRYQSENILVHEFSHAIHLMGLNSIDRRFDKRLRKIYTQAMEEGLWKKKYAATNSREYWAEGVQSYFDTNRHPDHDHNHVRTRETLAKYDSRLFELIDETFRKTKWRYVRYDKRHPEMKKFKKPELTIQNKTEKIVRIYRLQRDKRRFHVLVEPKDQHTFATYPGYCWIAEIEGDSTPRRFATPAKSAVWTVE